MGTSGGHCRLFKKAGTVQEIPVGSRLGWVDTAEVTTVIGFGEILVGSRLGWVDTAEVTTVIGDGDAVVLGAV
jgi:hypothetical protein